MLLRWCYIWVMPQKVRISVQSPWVLTTKKLHIENLFSEATRLPAGSTHPRRERPSSSSMKAAAERAHQSSRRLQLENKRFGCSVAVGHFCLHGTVPARH